MSSELRIEHRDFAGSLALREEMLAVYEAAEADQLNDPWASPEQFWDRLVNLYGPAPGFGLVAGWLGDELAGYAFGSPLVSTSIWEDVRRGLPDLELPTAPEPLYIFREFAVHPKRQRQGYGRALHDALLATRPERLAYLCVRPDNPAQQAYQRWGWRKTGKLKPFAGSPVFDVLTRAVVLPKNGA